MSGRIEGTHAGSSSADWLTIAPDGLWLPDVRLAIHTHDNAIVLMHYTGRLRTEPGQPATPLVAANFQTGDERYRWLAELQAVGKGQRSPDGATIDYEFYELR